LYNNKEIEVMKGVFHWLSMNLPRSPASDIRSEQDGSENDNRIANVDGLMPDIYGDAPTMPNLPTIDLRAAGTHELEDYDPYETARLRVK
jgi:hypothetical protein